MPARPELTRPDDAAIAAAMSRTLTVLAALIQALGDGEHTINLVAERTDDTFVRSQADLSVGTAPLRLAVLDEDDFDALRTLLVFALEGSTVRHAALVATTDAERNPRACGWTVPERVAAPHGPGRAPAGRHPVPRRPRRTARGLRRPGPAPDPRHRRGESLWLTRPPLLPGVGNAHEGGVHDADVWRRRCPSGGRPGGVVVGKVSF